MDTFEYSGLKSRVLFGAGSVAKLNDEVKKLGLTRALVVTTPRKRAHGECICDKMGELSVGVFSEATMHTPVSVTERALAVVRETRADGVVSLGGGSTIGLGKAIALYTDVSQIVLPTTYAGSEMTTIIGQTENGQKTTQNTQKVLPETVIYDVDFTLSLPPLLSVTSGMNAIAHAVEALYARNTNPIVRLIAVEGIRALKNALPKISKSPLDKQARSDALYGAWLCAVCLGSSSVALHHKLCHVLGGRFDLPHSETHAILLPHALAYNAPAVEKAMEQLRRATDTELPALAFYELAKNAGAAIALRDLGMPEAGIDRAVEDTMQNSYWNPRELHEQDIRDTIRAAWEGKPPRC